MRIILLFAAFLFLVNAVHAQDALTGRIYENKKRVTLPGIVVQNLNTHSTVLSDGTGGFSIPAKVGDLVVFSNFAYQPDTLYVKDLKYTEVSLNLRQNMLKEVKVTGTEVRLGNLKAAPTLSPINSQALTYSTDASGNYKGGLTASIFDSHAGEKKREKIATLEKNDRIMAQIDTIFSPENLKNFVPIQGVEMSNFIQLYTPDVKTYTDPSFELTEYLSTCYKEFLKIPAATRKAKMDLDLK